MSEITTQWAVYECDCGQPFALQETAGDEIEEPTCPVCGDNHSKFLGFLDTPHPLVLRT